MGLFFLQVELTRGIPERGSFCLDPYSFQNFLGLSQSSFQPTLTHLAEATTVRGKRWAGVVQSWTGALVSPSFEVEPDNPYTQLRSDLAVFTLCPAPFSVFSPSLSVLDVKTHW